jgi:hypothetical protein
MVERCWDETHPGPPYKSGGPFTLVRGSYPVYAVKGDISLKVGNPNQSNWKYEGGFSPFSMMEGSPTQDAINVLGLNLPYSQTWFDATPYGPAGYAKARPKIEKMDLGTAVGELRDLPRMLKSTSKLFRDIWKGMGGNMSSVLMQPKKVADAFLNHQFGWKPFLSDLGKSYDLYQSADKHMSQIERDNGKWVRRVRTLSNTTSINHINRAYYPWATPYEYIAFLCEGRTIDGQGCNGYTDLIRHESERIWFVGSFKYYRPEFDRTKPWFHSNYGKTIRLLKTYGLQLSPAVVWNLTPWSWLADWFSNAGDQIEYRQAEDYDGLVSNYAYVMRSREETYSQNMTIFLQVKGEHKVSWNYYVVSKDRRGALSPYGFDVSWDSLTPKQLAILSALLISRD